MSVTSPDLDAQYRLLREEAGTLERPDRVILELTGPETAEFLQGQLTNDIEALAPGSGCYAALLDRKGKITADMRVFCLAEDRFWVETGTASADGVERHLTMYKVGREIEVERPQLAQLELIGPRSPELLDGPLGPEHSHGVRRLAETDVRVIATDHGASLIADAEGLGRVRELLTGAGAEQVSADAAEILRVESGRPALGRDFDPGATIPQEAGLNERAVSFEKGCYIGQETVARLHYKGKPNRHLRRLRSSQQLEPGAPVRLGERELGKVGTAVLSPATGPVALAILRREAEPGVEVEIEGGGSATVEAIEAEADA